MHLLPIGVLAINFLALLLDLVVLTSTSAKAFFFRLPVGVQKLFVCFVVGPLFVAPMLPQERVRWSGGLALLVGLVLLGAGLGAVVAAFTRIGVVPSLRKKSTLITTGVYAIVRHPIYSGTLTAALGWAILLGSGLLLAYFPVLFGLYLWLTVLEERGLVEEYGDEYLRYKATVRTRLVPFLL